MILVVFISSCAVETGDHPGLEPSRALTASQDSTAGYAYQMPQNGALLLTAYGSLDELKEDVDISYEREGGRQKVILSHSSGGMTVTSELSEGVDQSQLYEAKDRGLLYRGRLVLREPALFFMRKDLVRVELLARWRSGMFGEGDLAFYDIAQQMVFHIHDLDIDSIPPQDLSEKGYINTFNHVTAQAMITSIFSEELADMISDLHERFAMPELITGVFSDDQLNDLETGPLDNYLDMVNNEWGQELGKYLKAKYRISGATIWTPELLADYLNDIQDYYSWTFGIAFVPFKPSDRMVKHYAAKLNATLYSFEEVTKGYY